MYLSFTIIHKVGNIVIFVHIKYKCIQIFEIQAYAFSTNFQMHMKKYAHRRNVILRIIKTHYYIVKTRPSNVNCENINAIGMGPTHARPVQSCHHHKFIILLISSSA